MKTNRLLCLNITIQYCGWGDNTIIVRNWWFSVPQCGCIISTLKTWQKLENNNQTSSNQKRLHLCYSSCVLYITNLLLLWSSSEVKTTASRNIVISPDSYCFRDDKHEISICSVNIIPIRHCGYRLRWERPCDEFVTGHIIVNVMISSCIWIHENICTKQTRVFLLWYNASLGFLSANPDAKLDLPVFLKIIHIISLHNDFVVIVQFIMFRILKVWHASFRA